MTRIGCPITIAIALLLAGQPAHGRSEYRLGGGGEYLDFDSQNQVARQVQVAVAPYGDSKVSLADFSDTSMRPLHIAPVSPPTALPGIYSVATSCAWAVTACPSCSARAWKCTMASVG